jgi:hypothetical protein
MYHGLTPWSEPRSFDALLDVPPSLRPAVEPYLVRFTYLLLDLSEISDDELRAGAMRTALAKLVTMCFKHARTGADFVPILVRWMDVAREVARAPNGVAALSQVMRYILEVNEHIRPEALQALLVRDIGPETKDIIVTAGQELIEQGRKQGRQEGRKQGIQEVLLRQLRQRFGARWTRMSSNASRRPPSSRSRPGSGACSRPPRSLSCWPTDPRLGPRSAPSCGPTEPAPPLEVI